MRPTGTSTFRSAPTRNTGNYPTATSTQMDQGEGSRASDRKRDPLDFALWKAAKAGRGHALGVALGSRPAGLAHRVLGDGGAAARARFRDPRRRQRPALPPPRERGRADVRRPRRAAGPAVDAQRHGPARPATKMSKSVGNVFVLHEALDALRSRRADHVLLRRPLPPADRVRRRAPGRGRSARCARIREAGARTDATAPAPSGQRRCASASSTRWPTTSTRRGRWRRCSTGCARPTAAPPARSATPICARCSTCSGSPTCSSASRRGARGGRARSRTPASRPGRERDFARADRLRDELRELGWEVRDGPDGPELLPARA